MIVERSARFDATQLIAIDSPPSWPNGSGLF